MVQVGRTATARRLFENFKKFSKITEFEFQNSGPSFFASVSPVYCKKIGAIPAVALLQQHDARRDILIEPAVLRRAAIEARGHSELGAFRTGGAIGP